MKRMANVPPDCFIGSLVWLRSVRPRRRRIRLDKNRELLRSHDWIDIELGHSFDPHLVTKSGVKDNRRRVIGDGRAKMIVNVHLFPNSAIFEPDLGVTFQAVNAAINATSQ